MASVAPADVPTLMQYQGFLTDEEDEPLNDTLSITFTIYPDPYEAVVIWTETQTDVIVTNGLFHVLLGSVNPISDTVFADTERWLGITVDPDPEIVPRTRLVTVPYAYRAATVDGARGGNIVGDVQLRSTLTVGSLEQGDPGRIEVTDGVDPVIVADGLTGQVGIGTTSPSAKLDVADAVSNGICVSYPGGDGLLVSFADDDGIHVAGPGMNGVFVSSPGLAGVEVVNPNRDGVAVLNPVYDGLYVSNAGETGVVVSSADFSGISARGKRRGGAFLNDTTGSTWPTLYLENEYGSTSSERIAHFYAGSLLRFSFRGDGYAYADGNWNTWKKNGKGEFESFSSIQAERQEIISHGTGRLAGGIAQINFSSSFSEFITDAENIEIMVTSLGSYSGLYVAGRTKQGFTVKSGAGDPNCEFTWIAIGVEEGEEERPLVGEIEEQERMARQSKEERMKRHEEKARSK